MIKLIKLILRKVFPRRRYVILFFHDKDTQIKRAYGSNSGWVANWYNNPETWSILLPNGKTSGYSLVKNWLPHKGWDGTELNLLIKEKRT